MNFSLIITIVVAFMQVLIVFIPLKGELSLNRRLTSRGFGLIFCCFIVALLTVILFCLSEQKDEENEKTLNTQLKQRDSIHQKIVADAAIKYIDRLDKSSLETAKALARYGLKYDETRKEIFKVVSTDTLRPSLDPEITISNIKLDTISTVNNYCVFDISLANQVALAKKVKLDLYLIAFKGDHFYLLKEPTVIFAHGLDMILNMQASSRIRVPYNNESDFYFYLMGNYKNAKGEFYKLQRVYSFGMKSKEFGSPENSKYKTIMKLLKRNNIFIEEN